jgi:hypothetical protein
MRNKIRLALLLLLIVVVAIIVGERSIHSGSQALVSHHPEPVVAAQDAQVSHSQGLEVAAASTRLATATAENEMLKPRHRGVYRPRRPAAQSVTKDWVRIPGTGVALWPKPASSGGGA